MGLDRKRNDKFWENIIDFIIKWRFVISIIVFTLCIIFKIHGSSIGMWDGMITEKINPQEKNVIIGENRAIRSDEWSVQSTYYFAQAMSDDYYPLMNKEVSENGQNMILSYNAPVANITVIGKPFNWGFLLLGKEYGLSWYWAFKVIALILLSFELSMILTKKNKVLSLVGAFWITYSPAVQWWFMQHVGDIVFFSIAMIVSFCKYFEYHESTKYRIVNSVIFATSTIGFALVIYPALQVPFAYLILVLMAIVFFKFIKNNKLNKVDYVLISSILICIASILGYFFIVSHDAIALSLNTVYPGKRVSLGGGTDLFRLSDFIINTFIPYKDIYLPNMNDCEVSSFINFFFGSVIILIASIKKKKVDGVGISLFIISVCQLIWSFVEFPQWFAKITFLSYVTSSRMILAFNFTAMLLSIWAIGVLFREKLFSKKVGILVAIVNFAFYVGLIITSIFTEYVSMKSYIIVFSIYLVINISLFCGIKKLFYISMSIIIVVSGMTVNPVARGVGAIYNKTLSKAIIDISNKDTNGVWIAEGEIKGDYLYANGAKTFGGTQFYPDKEKWDKIDPKGENEFYYNRYAHVKINLSNEKTSFNLDFLDAITVNMSLDDMSKINVKYIVTNRDLENEFSDSSINFKKLYNSDVDNIKIYEALY